MTLFANVSSKLYQYTLDVIFVLMVHQNTGNNKAIHDLIYNIIPSLTAIGT